MIDSIVSTLKKLELLFWNSSVRCVLSKFLLNKVLLLYYLFGQNFTRIRRCKKLIAYKCLNTMCGIALSFFHFLLCIVSTLQFFLLFLSIWVNWTTEHLGSEEHVCEFCSHTYICPSRFGWMSPIVVSRYSKLINRSINSTWTVSHDDAPRR
jgi:hypothetical protein